MKIKTGKMTKKSNYALYLEKNNFLVNEGRI